MCALAFGACGGGERQDADEPEGEFRVEAVDADFPEEQAIAQTSTLKIRVRNADTKTVPNVAVTVETAPKQAGGAPQAFAQNRDDPRLADPSRPVWILDRGPSGGVTAHTNTWALGAMRPGETKTFKWIVTAVEAGDYTVAWQVAPGLNGKARPAPRGRTSGRFRVTIDETPPEATIAQDGKTVLRDGKRVRKGPDLPETGGSRTGDVDAG